MTVSSRIYLPATAPEDWQRLLAEPDLHWKAGRSAHALAHSWQSADGFPKEVADALAVGPTELSDLELLIALPEHRVPLPGGSRASQTDLFVLARNGRGELASIAVEGKVSESFDKLVRTWRAEESAGKAERLAFLARTSGLPEDPDALDDVRYQLVHRTASAIIEARRFNAAHALMLVHSFSQEAEWFDDYAAFARLLGATPEKDSVGVAADLDGVRLHLGWVTGDPRFLQTIGQ